MKLPKRPIPQERKSIKLKQEPVTLSGQPIPQPRTKLKQEPVTLSGQPTPKARQSIKSNQESVILPKQPTPQAQPRRIIQDNKYATSSRLSPSVFEQFLKQPTGKAAFLRSNQDNNENKKPTPVNQGENTLIAKKRLALTEKQVPPSLINQNNKPKIPSKLRKSIFEQFEKKVDSGSISSGLTRGQSHHPFPKKRT